jgi:hypothetical protein
MKIGIIDSSGATHQADLNLELFRAAGMTGHKHGLAKLNNDIYTAAGHPTAAQQIYAQMGFGSTNLFHAMSGEYFAGAVTDDGSIAGRLAMQAYLMDATENKLRDNDYGIIGLLNSKAAKVDTIAATKFDRPQFDYSRPEAGKARATSQLSEPAMMLSITTSDKSYKIAGTSIGMEISDEASKAINLDLVALAMTRQAEEAAIDYAEGAFLSFLQGDADAGMAALGAVTAKSFDNSITAAGVLTQDAWMAFMFAGSRHRRIDTIITDLAGAKAIQNRLGRPVVTGDNGTSPRIDTLESILNPTWSKKVDIIVSQDPAFPAHTICGFDSRYAYHVVNSSVLSYNAMEQFAIRRSTKVRVDTGVLAYRLYDQAWSVMTLTV